MVMLWDFMVILWNLMRFDVQNPCWLMISWRIILPNSHWGLIQERGIRFPRS